MDFNLARSTVRPDSIINPVEEFVFQLFAISVHLGQFFHGVHIAGHRVIVYIPVAISIGDDFKSAKFTRYRSP